MCRRHVDPVVGEADRVDVLVCRVLQLDRLVHHVAEQQVRLVVHHGIELRLRVTGHRLEIRVLESGLLQEQRPDLRHRVAGRHGDRLALDVLGLADVAIGKAHRRHRRRLQRNADGSDRCTLRCRLDHRRDVGVAERCRPRCDRLHRYTGASAFLDVQVDPFLVEVAALLAEEERRMLAVDVPVEQQHDLVLALRERG